MFHYAYQKAGWLVPAEPFARQMREDGEIHHHGQEQATWWQRAAEFGRGIYASAKEWVQESWTAYLDARQAAKEQDDGPAFER